MKIIQDTREKQPWQFEFYGFEQVVKTLKTGDYSVEGYEDKIFIERKRSTGELVQNIGKKSKAFFAELERAKAYEHRYLICEFPEENLRLFPQNSGIPEKALAYIRISANYLLYCISKIKNEYGVTIIYANSPTEAEYAVLGILDDIIRRP